MHLYRVKDDTAHGDLFEFVADAFIELKMHRRAVRVLDRLSRLEGRDVFSTWLKQAECYGVLGEHQKALNVYEMLLEKRKQLMVKTVNMIQRNQRELIGIFIRSD